MRFVLLFPCLVFFAICVSALPSGKKGMPVLRHPNHARGYETQPLFSWQKKAQKQMQRGNESKIESKKKSGKSGISALLLCQEDCTRIWNPAHPSTFWSDCNECCRKIGDAVAYC